VIDRQILVQELINDREPLLTVFANGEVCSHGRRRQVAMSFLCGDESEVRRRASRLERRAPDCVILPQVLSVQEDGMCSYLIEFRTPLVC
jgi:hypothetical protein